LRVDFLALGADAAYVSLKSTSSIMAISALSPNRLPNLIIRVYPPGRSPTLSATLLNNSVIAYLSLRFLKTIRLLCVPFSTVWLFAALDLVIKGSMNNFNALALATVVFILLCSIKEHAIFASIAFLWAAFLPK